MNTQDLEALEHLLDEADEQKRMLRLHFVNGEIYELRGFSIAQDIGEEYPHCTGVLVVRIVQAPEEKRRLFPPEFALFFHLEDVILVQEVETEKTLFQSGQ